MPRKPYRVEVNYPKTGKPKYFLVKDVKVKGKKRKIRKYIGSGFVAPSASDVEHYRKKYAYNIELRAAKKRAELSSGLYHYQYLDAEQLRAIEEIRHIYKTFTSLLTTDETSYYEQDFEVNYVKGTTSIEGNTFSLEETHDLLVNNLAPKEKPLREINEVQNFRKVKTYRDKYRGKISVNFIKTLHSLIMSNIDLESAGAFRRIDDVGITGCDLAVTPAIMIEPELNKIIDDYYKRIDEGYHPFEEIVMFHYKFEMIHPFTDGNGRVGREIFNCMLTRNGYPRLLFLGSERDTYIGALRLGNNEKNAPMIELFSDLIIEQRLSILTKNLERVVVAPQKTGQLRLTDFYEKTIDDAVAVERPVLNEQSQRVK